MIRDRAENKRADEKAGKKSCYETRKAFDSKESLRSRCENAAAVKCRSNVSGKKEVVEFKARTQRQQDDQFADIARFRQAVQTGCDGDACACGSGRRFLLQTESPGSMGTHDTYEDARLGRWQGPSVAAS